MGMIREKTIEMVNTIFVKMTEKKEKSPSQFLMSEYCDTEFQHQIFTLASTIIYLESNNTT